METDKEKILRLIEAKQIRIDWLEDKFRGADCWKSQTKYLNEATRLKQDIANLKEIYASI